MKFIGIIPARYASTRFPGKPLADINGKPMIQLVYEKAKTALNNIWVATDDKRIFNAVIGFGGKVILTSPEHKSGTDRCAEAAEVVAKNINFDVVVNIQGDEPFIDPGQIKKLINNFDKHTQIATLIKPINVDEDLTNPNKPKVVIGLDGSALYFSRSPIPYLRDAAPGNWVGQAGFWNHVGMYAYKAGVLQEITKLKPGILEQVEALEQLRWLENGYKIKTVRTNIDSFGIDTPEDLKDALQRFQ
ncbi:MAG: 3-deoxy-manno-octulosonate cytidylyltransferase [Chlorobi bacterium]|nr:3-deoxy-manno-octulosonate cytidylyltransferase [Chlorobiota bacterium]